MLFRKTQNGKRKTVFVFCVFVIVLAYCASGTLVFGVGNTHFCAFLKFLQVHYARFPREGACITTTTNMEGGKFEIMAQIHHAGFSDVSMVTASGKYMK